MPALLAPASHPAAVPRARRPVSERDASVAARVVAAVGLHALGRRRPGRLRRDRLLLPGVSEVALSVLLPVRNEGINLRLMLKMLRGMVEVPNEVLVVFDSPED